MFGDDSTVAGGDGAFTFDIPEWLDGLALTAVGAYVSTASSSGIVQVQLHNVTDAVDMLSTRVQIDANELVSKDSATQPVVNAANAGVAWGDLLRVDVDAAGTGAMGLGLDLLFT